MARWILTLFLLLIVSSVSANTSRANCLNCDELLAEAEDLRGGEWLVLTQDEDITFLYRAIRSEIDSVFLCCGIQENLILLDEESKLWSLTYHVPRLDEAAIGYSFWEMLNEEVLSSSDSQVWRGANAPVPPPYISSLQGRVDDVEIESEALNESRPLTIYYPPDYDAELSYPVIYMADGQSVWGFSGLIEQLIVDEDIAPMLLVGVHSGEYRWEEYRPKVDEERFAAHEQFFTEEVRLWAEETLGASTETSQRAVYGHSNGGIFAATMALLHPDLYGIAFPFSMSMNPFEVYPDTEVAPEQRLYFTAGTLEPEFLARTKASSEVFAEAGAELIFRERVAGHDYVIWGEEFYYAVRWAFGD